MFKAMPLSIAICLQMISLLPAQLPVSGTDQPNTIDAISRTDATVLVVQDQPFFARVIQHNGESFGFLKSLGFNTVQLAACATPGQLDEARATGIWLVCPPPSSVGLQPITFSYDPVIAWSVGNKATARHSRLIQETVREIRASERRTGRPVIATIESHCETISTLVDIPVIGRPTVNSTFPARLYSDWIAARTQLVAKPFWADVPTHFPPGLNRQALAMSVVAPTLPLQHQQLKFLIYEVITGGARGIRFLSRQRLDVVDPETQLRALALRWTMKQLEQLEPWISGGLVQRLPSESESVQIHQVRLPDSRLVLAQRTTGWEQYLAGDVRRQSLSISPFTTSVADQAYLIDELGARRISGQQKSTGTQLVFEQCGYAAAALVTQSPGPPAFVNQVSGAAGPNSMLQDRFQLSHQSHATVQMILQRLSQLGQTTTGQVLGAIEETGQQLQNAQRMVATGDQHEALKMLQTADALSALVQRQWLESRFDLGGGIAVSPLLMHVGLVPDHDAFSARLSAANWNPNALTAGDFENLEQMLDSGWTNRRADLSTIKTRVTLEKTAARGGSYGLQLTATDTAATTVVPVAPLWIESAGVNVKKGQLVRFHGYVNLPDRLQGTGDGLIIVDSLGGPDLAARIQRTDGWQEFAFYRAAERDTRVTVTFMLTGLGSAMIDEVTIRTLDLSSIGVQAQQQATAIK